MVGEPGYAKRCASRYTNVAGMEANQRNARWSGFAATRFPHRRDGGDLSYGGSFPKSDTNGGEPEERMGDGIRCSAFVVRKKKGGSQAVDGGVTRMPLEKLLSA